MRDYGISISIGRVYFLMKLMNLPKMSKVKPVFKKKVSLTRQNYLKQAFNPPAPNQVWISDFFCIPMDKKTFAHLYIALDLFSRKIIALIVEVAIDINLAIKY